MGKLSFSNIGYINERNVLKMLQILGIGGNMSLCNVILLIDNIIPSSMFLIINQEDKNEQIAILGNLSNRKSSSQSL